MGDYGSGGNGRMGRLFGNRNGNAGSASGRPVFVRQTASSDLGRPVSDAAGVAALVLAVCGVLAFVIGLCPRR